MNPWRAVVDSTHTRANRARLGFVALLSVGVIMAVTWMLVQHILAMPRHGHYNDSYIYLSAASGFIDHPSHLYDNAHLQVVRSTAQYAFVHPPSGLLPYLPLVPLVRLASLPVAAAAWSVIDTVALFAALLIAARHLRVAVLWLAPALLLIAVSQPVHSEVIQGQVNGVALLLATLGLTRLSTRGGGVLLGLSLAVKPVSVFLLLVPLLQRRPWVAVIAVATIAVANLPFIALVGVSATVFYLQTVLPYFAEYVMRNHSNVSMAYVLQGWLSGGISRSAPFAVAVPRGLAATLILWTSRVGVLALAVRTALDRRIDAAIAGFMLLAAVPILTTTVWPHYVVYVLPLTLATLAASRPWVRLLGMAALVAFVGQNGGPLWLGIGITWVTFGADLATRLGWQIAAWPRVARSFEPTR